MRSTLGSIALGLLATAANASTVTFDSVALGSIPSIEVGGMTVTASSSDGFVDTLTSGPFQGLYIGGTDTFGTYELSFSREITSISISFFGLSGFFMPEESISGFSTEDGAVSVNYTNLSDTLFDGNSVTSTNSDGQQPEGSGVISYAAPAFSSFFFTHSQSSDNGGFVIDEIIVSPVPLPASWVLLLGALGLLAACRHRGQLSRLVRQT